jgi:hypothetical protein
LKRLLASDGAELSVGIESTDGTPCELQRTGECVPEPIARVEAETSGKFWTAVNADCSAPAYHSPYPTSCGEARFGVRDEGGSSVRVYETELATSTFHWSGLLTDTVSYSCDPNMPGVSDYRAPRREVTGSWPSVAKVRTGTGPLYVDFHGRGRQQFLPVQADPARASPGVLAQADFVDEAGQPCAIKEIGDGTTRCVFVDDNGIPTRDLATYSQVVWGPI